MASSFFQLLLLKIACCRYNIQQAAKAVIPTGATGASFNCNASLLAIWHKATINIYSVQAFTDSGSPVSIFEWKANTASTVAQVCIDANCSVHRSLVCIE